MCYGFSGTHDVRSSFCSALQSFSRVLILFRSEIADAFECNIDRLVFNTAVLEDEETLSEAGIICESNIEAFASLDGGKRKRKKKVYTKPKKIKHKHKKRVKPVLEYFNIESSGKVLRQKVECEKCPVGKYPLFD